LHLFRFDVKIAAAVAEETDLPFVTAENKFEALVSDYMHTIVFICRHTFVDYGLLVSHNFMDDKNMNFDCILASFFLWMFTWQ
jgi:hypothetical protein